MITEVLNGQEVATTVKRSQVYQATHDGEGNTLPFMNRSFISFTFGGKKIEDFDLIATTVNNSLNREGFAPFNDITTSYDVLNGQQYWGTYYEANTMAFTLATDGIDQKKLDNFLHWFQAGETKELVLAEHPNRAILARVSEPPHLDLLPFESTVDILISDTTHTIHTTLYKGTIELKFVMDQPHWYSLTNILGKKRNDRYVDYYDDVNGNEVSIFASADALKILYEDGIPLGSMIQNNMLLGNGAYANVEDNELCKIWSIARYEDITFTNGEPDGTGARIEPDDATYPYTRGYIAGAIIQDDGNGLYSLSSGSNGYFYYSGTAPAPTIISFTLTPGDSGTNMYVNTPANSYVLRSGLEYSTFTVESLNKQELRFTTPNVYTSFNKVISLFLRNVTTTTTKSWEEVRELIRDEVRHPQVRAWANKILDDLPTNSTNIRSAGLAATLRQNMWNFLKDNGTIQPVTFTFNSETGEALGTFSYQVIQNNGSTVLTTVTEDVGDMLRSNYIILRDRNQPNAAHGTISAWTSGHKEYSHKLYHNCRVPLENISILYKNMYL